MSQDTFSYNVDTYKDMSNDYEVTDSRYTYLQDANNGIYTNGLIQFNSTSLYGADQSAPFEISQAYLQIPYQFSATIANGNWNDGTPTFVLQPDNINAVCCKGYHHLIHQVWAQMGQVNINNSASQYWNLYMNELLKKQTQEELLKDGNIINFYLDNAESYNYNSAIGEFNNNTMGNSTSLPANFATLIPNLPTGNVPENPAIALRNQGFVDLLSAVTNNGLVASSSTCGNVFQPYFINNGTTLTWYDVATIKLSDLLPFFKNAPSVSKLDGFQLKIATNLASTNTWTINYFLLTALTNAQYAIPNGITTTQSVGTCPFLISSIYHTLTNAGNPVGSNAVAHFASQTTGSVTISTKIGWGNVGGQSNFPCRLYIPIAQYAKSVLDNILSKPDNVILCNDFYLDTSITGQAGQTQVNKPIPVNLSRPRRMYILPFLSGSNIVATGTTATLAPAVAGANMISPILSPISSAPTTTSKCVLRNLNILIGGKPLFPIEPMSYNNHFYEQNAYPLMAEYAGNSVKSLFKSGVIKKSDFFKCYNTYTFDLKRVEFEEDDNALKSMTVQFFIDAPQAVKYDFYIILEYEKSYTIDRFSGVLIRNTKYD